jgi:hypothetical protein
MIPMRSIVFTRWLCRAGRTAMLGGSVALLAEALVHAGL